MQNHLNNGQKSIIHFNGKNISRRKWLNDLKCAERACQSCREAFCVFHVT